MNPIDTLANIALEKLDGVLTTIQEHNAKETLIFFEMFKKREEGQNL